MDIVERLMRQTVTGPDIEDIEFINPDGPDAADEIERLRSMLSKIGSVDADLTVPHRMYEDMTPKDCYEAGLLDGAMAIRNAVNKEASAALKESE